MQRSRILSTIATSLCVAALLSGCSLLGVDPLRYDKVNAILDSLRLADVGKLEKVEYYGGGASGSACYMAIISGPTSYEMTTAKLRAAGFTTGTGTDWDLFADGHHTAGLFRETPADSVPFPGGGMFRVTQPGALLNLC